jgi:four helix bundle protein
MKLGELEIYQLSIALGREAWRIYGVLPKSLRYSIGDQLLRSADSVGANIAEGFGRYHYLDSAKFYYNARGSLWETKHWFYLLKERKLIEEDIYAACNELMEKLGVKLNNFIRSTKSQNAK